MSEYHYWNFFRRIVCAAIAIAFASSAYCVLPALATESTVYQVAKTSSVSAGSKERVIAERKTASADAEPLSLLEPAAGTVEGDFAVPISDDVYELVVGVRRKSEVLSLGLLGLQKGYTAYIPAAQLASLIKFPVRIDLERGVITGSFFNVENTFEINAAQGTYTVLGETAKMPQDSYILRQNEQEGGDIYLTPDVLNKLWSLGLEFNFSQLELQISTPRKLPYELQRDRLERQKYFQGKDQEQMLDVIHVPSSYKTLGPQTLNLTENLIWDGPERDLRNSFSVNGRGDILGASADYTLNWQSSSEDKLDLNNARFRLTRRDYGDGRNLPFGLGVVQAGDVSAAPSRTIGSLINGRGFYFSTESNERSRNFDRVVIDGTAPPGWEVELYRGRELLDFSEVSDSGEYRFEDVQIYYGGNKFRIVLYGPQGQIEEREENYQIRGSRKPVGEVTLEGMVVDTRKRLFNTRDRKQPDLETSNYVRADTGLTSWASGFASFTEVPTRIGAQQYATVGASFEALDGVGQAEYLKQIDGGSAFDLRFARKIAGFNTNLQTTFFNDFESVQAQFGDQAKTFEGDVKVSRRFKLPFAGLNTSFGARHRERVADESDTRYSAGQNFTFKNFSIGHNINTHLKDSKHNITRGNFTLSSGLTDKIKLSGSLGYELYPDSYFDQGRLGIRYYDRENKFSASANVTQGIEETDSTRVNLRASYDFGDFLGGIETNWDRREGFDFIMRANTTFGPQGIDGAYTTSTEYDGFTTGFRAHIYEDRDFDGVYSQGDVPIEGMRLRLDQRPTDLSNENGIIDMLGAGRPRLVNVTLDEGTTPNPLLRPLKDGYSVVLREGTKPFVNFPLYQTGAIDGTVRLRERGRAVSGLILELVNQNGDVIDRTETLFDGFYVFEYVKPGTYQVRPAASYKFNVPPKTVSVSSERLFAYGVDILLEQASEESATDNVSVVRDGGRVAQKLHAPVADGTLKPAPTSSDRPSYTAVRAVRIGEHPYKVRLVLDLSAPSVYSISTEDDGQTINIDLQSTVWDVPKTWTLGEHPIFKNLETLALPDTKGTRIKLTAHKKARIYYNSAIPAENGLPDRIYVDFIKKD